VDWNWRNNANIVAAPAHGGYAPAHGGYASAGSALGITTDGASIDASVDTAAAQSWFSFHAQEGFIYQIETVIGTLDDTVVDLVGTDQSTVLAENDDDERDPYSYASYIEWTCPHDGTYYVMVKGFGHATGTFSLMVTEGALH
jgi:hypothetical protein